MIRKLEGLENILAVELGLPPNCPPDQLRDFLSAAEGELPVAICLGRSRFRCYYRPCRS